MYLNFVDGSIDGRWEVIINIRSAEYQNSILSFTLSVRVFYQATVKTKSRGHRYIRQRKCLRKVNKQVNTSELNQSTYSSWISMLYFIAKRISQFRSLSAFFMDNVRLYEYMYSYYIFIDPNTAFHAFGDIPTEKVELDLKKLESKTKGVLTFFVKNGRIWHCLPAINSVIVQTKLVHWTKTDSDQWRVFEQDSNHNRIFYNQNNYLKITSVL